MLSTPNGVFAEGNPNMFSSQLHINEFTVEDFKILLSTTGVFIHLFKQDRFDKLNHLWRERFKVCEQKTMMNLKLTGKHSKRESLIKHGYKFISNYFNDPRLWHINALHEKDFNSIGFSSIVAIVDLL